MTVVQMNRRMHDGRNNEQTKSSIAPLFIYGAIIRSTKSKIGLSRV